MNPKEEVERWKEYSLKLLNADYPFNLMRRENFYRVESMVSDVIHEKVKEEIKSLKNWKSPGSDEISLVELTLPW